jgi:lambda family phage minor tail protein L
MIAAERQKLSPSALVSLYVLDLTDIAPDLSGEDRYFRFTAQKNELGNDVVWQTKTYVAYPIQVEGFGIAGQGSPPRPTIRAANISGLLSALCKERDDILGAKLIRKRTFEKFLDAANFADGNPNADPDQYLPDDVYFIERKSQENNLFVEWELRWPFDLQGVLLPRRQIIQNTCAWLYKGAECGWVPVVGKYFDAGDTATDAAGDQCGKRLASCQLRFGQKAALPYGGFPGAGFLRK